MDKDIRNQDCTNKSCVTNITIDESVSFMSDNISADMEDTEVNNIYTEDISIKNITDIKKIKGLETFGIVGAICGRAIYNNEIDINKAIRILGEKNA